MDPGALADRESFTPGFAAVSAATASMPSPNCTNRAARPPDPLIDAYNADAKPFVWTKSEVHQKRLKARFADQ